MATQQVTNEQHPLPWTTSEGEIFDADGALVARTWVVEGVWGQSDEIRTAHRIVEAVNGGR